MADKRCKSERCEAIFLAEHESEFGTKRMFVARDGRLIEDHGPNATFFHLTSRFPDGTSVWFFSGDEGLLPVLVEMVSALIEV